MKSTALPRVSERRQIRLDRIGARGPLEEEARRRPCAACGFRARSDPAHLERVGKGYGDWKFLGGEWLGRVAALCRGCHDALDGNVWASVRVRRAIARAAKASAAKIGRRWARMVGVDVASDVHPYEQWRALGEPAPADLAF